MKYPKQKIVEYWQANGFLKQLNYDIHYLYIIINIIG